ncbi:tetratricopeptide repeat protein [Geomonas sp. RF6]|uniref:tetratricopeptide repeat protein n=1 Tax=Geomonas sp. RF6 TaxID=2897342 RepID=UPI001E55E35D|nr:tetratricopeptide repeat protein [Geomonas sp. RF6]UFS72439.1 tetratricopeptide repeat protein [Geomonas sp. RF6]
MAYDAFSTTDGLFSSIITSPDQQAQLANSAATSGLNYYKDKKYDRAVTAFQRAIALDPQSTQSYNFLANTYLAQKKTTEAIKTYKTSLAIDPSQDKTHVNLANIYLQNKQYKEAEKEFKEAIKLNPTDTVAPYTLGQAYQQQGKYAEAEAQFKKVIKMAPNDPNPYYALGMTLNKEKKYEEAVKQLTQAIRIRPKMASAHLELGTAYAALGDTTKANKEVDILTGIDPAQGYLLKKSIAQPRMLVTGSEIDWASGLGPNTQLYALDPTLITPGKSAEFTMTFYFDSKMDQASVQDPNNWTMNKASGGVAGYYNNTLAIAPTEAYIPQNPTRVVYDPTGQQATVTFMISQNAEGNATIDPSHMVFKFSGKDIKGRSMDPTGDEYDGYAQAFF